MLGDRFRLWNAVLVAIFAADPVDVVGAFGAGKCRVHFLDVDAAVGHLRVAVFTGGGCVLVVAGVTGEATDSFVNADGGAVVAGAGLRTVVICGRNGIGLGLSRGVALVTESLTLVGAYPYGPCAIRELREREQANGEVHLFATIIER